MNAELPANVYIGTAAWSVPKEHAAYFPLLGSHLERYAECFPAVEINSSFYRHHMPVTYARWAKSTPPGFRFSAKVPKEITHQRRLNDVLNVLDRFLGEVSELGDRLGPLLVQLPPSLAYLEPIVPTFFKQFRDRFRGQLACEPRHPTWFNPRVESLLAGFQVARVAADPSVVPSAACPGGWNGFVYYRLHGSPKMYYSLYSDAYLDSLAIELRHAAERGPAWCIFDNTAEAHATINAIGLLDRMRALHAGLCPVPGK
jgi:uncharacterized protein YecE (DUF72 family)